MLFLRYTAIGNGEIFGNGEYNTGTNCESSTRVFLRANFVRFKFLLNYLPSDFNKRRECKKKNQMNGEYLGESHWYDLMNKTLIRTLRTNCEFSTRPRTVYVLRKMSFPQ
jgi:hypothetical protein